METLKSQHSFFCTLLNYRDGDWPQPVLLHQPMQSEYIDAFWIYCWNVTPSFYPKWGMLIFTGGTSTLIKYFSQKPCSCIHSHPSLSSWAVTCSLRHSWQEGLWNGTEQALCHFPQRRVSPLSWQPGLCLLQDNMPQTPWYLGFNPRGIQKALPLLEALSFSWQKGTGSLSLELILIRSRGTCPRHIEPRIRLGRDGALPLEAVPALAYPYPCAPTTQSRATASGYQYLPLI